MRRRSFCIVLACASILLHGSVGFCLNGGYTGTENGKDEAAGGYIVPVNEVDDIFDARSELKKLKALRAEAEHAKELIEESYETFAREADLERKRAEELEKNIAGLQAMLKDLEDKDAIRDTKEKIKGIKEQLTTAQDRAKLAVSNTDLEIKKAEDLERKIKLLDDKIEQARLRVNYEMSDLYNKYAGRILGFVSLILIVFLIRVILLKLVVRYVQKDDQKYYFNKIIKVVSWTVIILCASFLLIGRLEQFMLLISFIGAGVAIALKDVITSFVAWFFIIGPNGYHVGDRIELGDIRGDVVDVSLFMTSLMEIGGLVKGEQAAGRIASFPNHLIFSLPLYNYTTGSDFLWNEVSFLVTFESDWRKAEEIMLAIVTKDSDRVIKLAEKKMRSMSAKYMVRFGTLTPAVYVVVSDSGVELTVRYLTAARMRRVTQDRISREILDAINRAEDIHFAYPTIRYYSRSEETK